MILSSSADTAVLQWVVVAIMVVVVVCVSEGVAGAGSDAVSQQEGAALCALLHSTRGDSWRWRPEAEAGAVWNCSVDAAGGLVHNPCSHGGSSWQGVTCSGTPAECSSQVCQVTQLDLTSYGMTGPIPPEIGNLTSLEILNFQVNLLTGSIPVEIGKLSRMHQLFLNQNLLTGSIPVEVGLLTFLEILYLHTNQLGGRIPIGVWQLALLQHLYLYTNLLTGPIPSDVGQLTNLRYFSLGSNSLTGSIPVEFGRISGLEILYLFENDLMGPLPNDVGLLTALKYLALYSNSLTGPFPILMKNLSTLRGLYLYDNLLTGTIPIEVGHLTSLTYLSLSRNQLIGNIPVEVGLLTALETLFLHSNRFTGPILKGLRNLTSLKQLALYNNYLTGTIPIEVGQLTALQLLYLDKNLLSGPIPLEVGHLAALEVLVCDFNHLTGTIPVDVGQLTALHQLYLHNNILMGPIPAALGHLTALNRLYLNNNHLTGFIPFEVGQMTTLAFLYFSNNQLTGCIPSSIKLLINIEEIQLHNNRIGGKLPVKLSSLRKLRILSLQNNVLTGSLEGLFNQSAHLQLSTIDISNNRLTGALPAEMFLLFQLQVLSLSVNCFDDELPHSICEAEKVEVLSLNGLRSSEGCTARTVLPLSGVALFNTIDGTVPPCLWNLRNLTVVHLVGNGFSGELIPKLPEFSQLFDISLSHNRLSGKIPLDFLKVAKLDLSFNQFEGEYAYRSQEILDTDINLEINRLSGQLPVSGLQRLSNSSLRVLRGNMFSCNTIPDTDEYSHDYVCGSLHLNYSLFSFMMALSVVLAMLLMALSMSCQGKGSIVYEMGTRLWTAATFLLKVDVCYWPHTVSNAIYKIMMLSGTFLEIMKCAVNLLIVVLVGSSSLYIVKLLDTSGDFATHSHTYSWFWTLAYMRGVVPAGLLILVWVGAISACFYRVVVFDAQVPVSKDSNSSVCKDSRRIIATGLVDAPAFISTDLVPICVAFVFNGGVTIIVNTLYIFSTQQDLGPSVHFVLQLSLSIFRLAYTVILLPMLTRSMRSPVAIVRFRSIVLTINSLLIPCFVTALTSDACFQGFLIPAEAVSTPYSYDTCLIVSTDGNTGISTCTEYSTKEVESAPLIPPFTYNNQCGSVLLTSYIPVLLLGYSIQLLLSWILVALQVHMSYESFPSSIRSSLHGLMWPEYWRQGGDTLVHNKATVSRFPTVLLQIRTIFCNDILNNWLLLMTFGLCSPILAVAIVCCLLLKMSLWVILVGRYTKCILEGLDRDDTLAVTDSCTASCEPSRKGLFALDALAQVYIPLFAVLSKSFWLIAWCSALFVVLLSWDMAADQVGVLMSLWVPLVPLFVVLCLHWAAYYLSYHERNGAQQQVTTSVNSILSCDEECSNRDIIGGVLRSPLHIESGAE